MKYNLDQFNFMNNTTFEVVIIHPTNVLQRQYLEGVSSVGNHLSEWARWPDLEKTLFRVFLDNKQKEYKMLYLDDKGDIMTEITISLEEK
ncbi:MAG: hypothetical protein GY928_05765 [Colwellia sp.]|nr:hypothetical protein [Colwellia sp.]